MLKHIFLIAYVQAMFMECFGSFVRLFAVSQDVELRWK